MARTSRRQPNSYRGGRVVGNLAYDERYAERRAPRRESEQREQPHEEFIRPPRRREKKVVRPRMRERQRVSGVLVLGFAALAAMVVVVLMSYAQLTSISADVVSMQKELKMLDAEHVALLTQYERTFDLETVKAAAAAAGSVARPSRYAVMTAMNASSVRYAGVPVPARVRHGRFARRAYGPRRAGMAQRHPRPLADVRRHGGDVGAAQCAAFPAARSMP